MWHHGGDCLALPDDFAEQAAAGKVARPGGAARKRQRSELPREFCLVARSGPLQAAVGRIRIASVCRMSRVRCSADAYLQLQVQLRAHRGLQVTNSLCWQVAAYEAIPRVVLPSGAAKRWNSALYLDGKCPAVQELHRACMVPLGSMQAWLVDSSLEEGITSGSVTWLATAAHHATLCGIALPVDEAPLAESTGDAIDAHVSGNVSATLKFRIRRGFAIHRYSVPAVMNALELSWAMRNTRETSMSDVVKLAWRCSLPADQVASFESKLASGEIQIPQRSMLNVATVKLDVLYSVWQRDILQRSGGWRYLLADSSPIQGTSHFCLREDRVIWEGCPAHKDILQLPFEKLYQSRHLPLSTLGLGAAGEVNKGCNLCHAILLESGSWPMLCKYRSQVRGYCSDQGVEAALADAGMALSSQCDMASWDAMLDSAKRGQLQTVPDAYLLPLAIFVPDHLHMVFGALEAAAKGLQDWSGMEAKLKALSKFLSKLSYRNCFVALCVADPCEKAVLNRYIGEVTDWKWEYVALFLFRVREVLPILQRRFDIKKFAEDVDNAEGGSTVKLEASVLEDIKSALADPLLTIKCEVLRSVAFAVDRQATRIEGCACHEHLLNQAGKWSDRVRKYRDASSQCMWKGKRGVGLALGMPNQMLEAIQSASDGLLRQAYAAASSDARACVQQMESTLKGAVLEILQSKLRFWSFLPYTLLGIAGCQLSLCSLQRSKAIACDCIAEYDAAVEAGRSEKLHRVAVHFLGQQGSLRPQLLSFAQGVEPLEAYPELSCELRAYALVPCVARRIEAVHAVIKAAKRKANRHNVPWVGAKVRRLDVTKELHTHQFMSWLEAHWHSRDIIRRSLRCAFPWRTLASMSMGQLLAWWYQSSANSQFRKVQAQAAKLKEWNLYAKAAQKPDSVTPPDGQKLLLAFFKSVVSQPGVLWSAPKNMLEDAQGAAAQQQLEQRPQGQLQIADRLCHLVEHTAQQGRQPVSGDMKEAVFSKFSGHTLNGKRMCDQDTSWIWQLLALCTCRCTPSMAKPSVLVWMCGLRVLPGPWIWADLIC